MSCSTCNSGTTGGISVGNSNYMTELTRVIGIEEANKLLAEDYSFVSMYFNQAEQKEVYVLAKLKPISNKKQKTIGFIPRD
ncbi:hypothetical protein [Desulfotomaculum sp. 1211_IL3151]|uniref:hypothetical protein n=1 Tax=Desulfotomaculum sp. 1211_IL3151 TaxID=3084055 RepID=UPI002FD8D59B